MGYHNLICRGLPNGCPCVHLIIISHFTKLAKSDRMTRSETFHVLLSIATGLTSTKLETKHHAQVKWIQIVGPRVVFQLNQTKHLE